LGYTYLSSVHVPLAQLVKVRVAEQLDSLRLVRHSFHLADVVLPDLLARLGLQVLVANAHVDTALERFVERLNAIRCQEQDTLVVLRQAQEHRHKAVAVDIMGLTGFEEHVGFVKEKDGTP
jgi:hypothetical protein